MNFSNATVKQTIETRFPDAKVRLIRDSLLLENPEDLTRIALLLKEDPTFLLDYLSSVTGADYLTYLESVYHLYSMAKKQGPVVLRVRVPKKHPSLPSLVPIYHSAELQEREAYDTFGIVYEGHPDLRRLFMWETFEGFPLRKDFQQEDTDILEAADIAWLEARGIAIPADMKEKAKELKATGQRAVAQTPEKPR